MNLRNKRPQRRADVEPHNDYHYYRKQLEEDFFHHCGYCGDLDKPRTHSFEIDHFVPKKVMITIRENDYSNLVYSCKSCNNAKRAKWPTNDEKQCNNGNCGWIDPCDPSYDEQLERDENGNIKAITELGDWMYENLKLYKSQHRLLWSLEQINRVIDEFDKYIDKDSDKDILMTYIELKRKSKAIFDKFYEE